MRGDEPADGDDEPERPERDASQPAAASRRRRHCVTATTASVT